MGAFMEWFGKDLSESGELVDTRGLTAGARPQDPPAGRRACGHRWHARKGRRTAVSIMSSNGVPIQEISDTVAAS